MARLQPSEQLILPPPLVHKSVIALGAFILATPDVRILFNLMLEQVPYGQDPTGASEVQTVDC